MSEFENEETTSDLLVEPTLIAVEMQAGAPIPLLLPSFPDAITVAIPTERRLSIAALRAGSLASQGEEEAAPPRLRLTEAIGKLVWRESTCSSAATWSEV